MQIHNLKTWPQYWDAVYSGKKTFEIRKNDRPFVIGDMLNLWKWDPEIRTGELHDHDDLVCVSVVISYILPIKPQADEIFFETEAGGSLLAPYVILAFERTNALPNLKPAELERLAWLAEESAEVIKAAMKTVRHGYASYNPDDPDAGDNRVQLSHEIGDFFAVSRHMQDRGDLETDVIIAQRNTKVKNAQSKGYLHHQG